MNILIPMAGAGSRFRDAGYTLPKPLIDVHGKPMIARVVESLGFDGHHIFLVQQEHLDKYDVYGALHDLGRPFTIVPVDGVTAGAACTTLLAEAYIDNDEPLIIANSDQYIVWSHGYINSLMSEECRQIGGAILTFTATHPKWSFAKINELGYVTEVAEKRPISDRATVGVYYWRRGAQYVQCAKQMIEKDIRTNNEFYVCPVYNEAIAAGALIQTIPISKMWGLGTPEDLQHFLQHGPLL